LYRLSLFHVRAHVSIEFFLRDLTGQAASRGLVIRRTSSNGIPDVMMRCAFVNHGSSVSNGDDTWDGLGSQGSHDWHQR
jgi:hypothetical protein